MDSTIKILLEALELLTKPAEKGQASSFDDVLQQKTDAVRSKLLIPPDMDLDILKDDGTGRRNNIRWRFTCLCLYVLVTLRDVVMLACEEYTAKLKSGKSNPGEPPPPSPDLFSVQQQKAIQTCMQFVISLGVLPYLMPGVGVPIEQRMGASAVLQVSHTEIIGDVEKYNRLVAVTKTLLRCLKQPTLGSLILCRHLGDLLASLCQLSFAPLKKPDSSHIHTAEEAEKKMRQEGAVEEKKQEEGEIEKKKQGEGEEEGNKQDEGVVQGKTEGEGAIKEKKQEDGSKEEATTIESEEINENKSFVMTLELWKKLQDERKSFQQALISLLDRVYQPMAVKELLLLQGPAPVGANKDSKIRAPVWLRKACGQLLSGRLMKKRGVISVIQGILDMSSYKSNTAVDWKKLEVIAKLIANPPSQFVTAEDYYKTVCPQVIELLSLQDDILGKQYVKVASTCILALSQRSEAMSEKYIFNVIMEPLHRCCISDENDGETAKVSVSEEELSVCIQNLHKCFVIGTDPWGHFLMNLTPVIFLLLHLHCAINFGVSHLKSQVQELIFRYVKHCDPKLILKFLRAFAFNDKVPGIREFNNKVQFSVGSEGGIKASQVDESIESNFFVVDDQNAVCLIDILLGIKDSTLVSEFFLQLLQDLTSVLGESGVKLDPQCVKSEEELLNIERQVDNSIRLLRKSLMVIRLLSLLSESDVLQETLMKNTCQLISFVQATLERGAKLCDVPDKAESGIMVAESLTMAMSILVMLTAQKKLKTKEWEVLKNSLDPLKVLMTSYPDEKVQNIAEKLSLTILTHGAIQNLQTSNQKEPQSQTKNNAATDSGQLIQQAAAAAAPAKSPVEVISSSETQSESQNETKTEDNPVENKSPTSPGMNPDAASETEKSEFQKAVDELQDPLIPVRGHGLLTLTKLLLMKDEETMKEQELLLYIFIEHLEHPDSYIYLMAIQGLVTMATDFPDRVVLTLTKEYGLFNRKENFGSKSSEVRMKIGEALVRVIKILGDVTPKYKGPLLNSFLVCTKDPDHLVRASSLSNLGETCKALRFSLGPVVNELFSCLDALLHTDPATEVRRAAILVVTFLLQGLGDDALKVLEDNLLDIYRGLKFSYQKETDNILKLHILLALEELDRIARRCLFPEQTFTKKITVLDPS